MVLRRLFLCALTFLLLVPALRAQMLADIVERRTPLSEATVEVVGKRSLIVHASAPVETAFDGVAVEARSDDATLRAEVRFLSGGFWGDWVEMRVVRSAVGPGLVAGYHGAETSRADRFEVRLSTAEGSTTRVLAAGVFVGGEPQAALPEVGLVPIPGRRSGDIIPPPLITRSEWGARPFQSGSPVPLAQPDHDFMTFHHAAGFSATTREDGLAQVRAIQDLHQDVRGWSDIGYHFVIDRGGRLYQGRPFLNNAESLSDLPVFAQGAHVGGANTGNIGICLLGCYHPPEGGHCQEEITPEALNTYVTLFAFLSERYGVAASQIRGHRDFSSTACPGDSNYALLPEIRTAVADLLVTGNAPIAQATLTAEIDASGVVVVEWTFQADFGVVSHRLERWVSGERDALLVEGTGTPAARFADASLSAPEGQDIEYRLYVTGADGREQQVATARVAVDLPTRHALAEVFPNPAAGSVRFRYFLPTQGRVSLEMFDTTGRRVAVLASGVHTGEQWYSVPFDASGLPGGVYYYRMVVEGFSGVVFEESHTLVIAP